MGRYAKKTQVGVAKSRGEIDSILTKWGADQLQWSDDLKNGQAMLRFIWEHDGTEYVAKFVIKTKTEQEIRELAVDGRNGRFSKTKFDDLMGRRGMVEHRELALLLKAIFVAVDAEIITAEQVFLPFLEDHTGMTVADVVLPHLAKIHQRGGVRLLMEGKR
jgi:hypothetical protein